MQRRRKPIILTVDDDAAMLSLLTHLLGDLGYEVAVAESGAQALGLFDQVHPDIVLTDIYMASGDGHELIGALRQKRRALPILNMSGAANAPEVLDFARKIGADGVVMKPFMWSQIVEMIDRHLWGRS